MPSATLSIESAGGRCHEYRDETTDAFRPAVPLNGGKWRIAPWVIEHLPPHRIYVEAYGGAASVLMRKPRSYAEVYNDLDHEVVGVFRVLRDPARAAELERQLRLTPWSRREFLDAIAPAEDEVESARRTILRAFMGFGTTSRRPGATGFRGRPYRDNATGVRDWVSYPDAIAAYVERLQGVCIEEMPALDLIRRYDDPEALIYCDPPYPASVRTSVRWPCDLGRAYQHDMVDSDHRELAGVLHRVRGMVVISGYACALYDDELYSGWVRLDRDALADGARRRRESLWISPRAWERLRGRMLLPAALESCN